MSKQVLKKYEKLQIALYPDVQPLSPTATALPNYLGVFFDGVPNYSKALFGVVQSAAQERINAILVQEPLEGLVQGTLNDQRCKIP